ncbi:CPBP family intramembrane glutamic endopeptidase [Pontibacter cellulosilyticus]|uniref:CPBP family intramembrane metalloprotease n=1 Tax=Pontibacter cellulosilyticus TaxID=1720253 RepID=A0A923SNH5_9BACT|nr:CPBP family intramembrane glutamic endopeptidase [Pontibacter cellulosilyticus]MBC5993205.1 CPBP family intramembrane metalloprotease [Pontibacter cellulosilyticus]
MKKLFLYLEDILMSRKWVLLFVTLSIAVVPTLTNLLFTSDKLRALLDNQLYFVGLGVVVYTIWLTLLYYLKKKDTIKFRHLSLTRSEITKGLLLSVVIYIGVNIALIAGVLLKGESLALAKSFWSVSGVAKALGVFFFNILLGAFIEELLCRAYLIPQGYLLLQKKIKYKVVALLAAVILTQLIFALAHLPAELFRFEKSLASIVSNQGQLFMSGLILSLVYLRTRNVVFVAVFHALMNYKLPIIDATDADFKFYYLVGAFVVAVFWDKIMKPVGAGKQVSTEADFVPGNLA